MDDWTRRSLLTRASIATTLAAVPAVARDESSEAADAVRDKGFVIAAGMTEAEAECWLSAAECAGKFFALPEMHPMDKAEIASAIHVIQNKLLSRPTYRKYLESAKAFGSK